MKRLETFRIPLITGAWMIALPMMLAFAAGAGAGTALDGIARFAATMWSIFGGVSIVLGVALICWVLVSALRVPVKDTNG